MRIDHSLGEHPGDRWAGVFTETVALAFRDAPTWSPAVESNADPAAAYRYWEIFVRSAQRFPWMSTVDDGAAVSIWLPPGADELTPAEEEALPAIAVELFGQTVADELCRIFDCFEAAHPDGEFAYLSLLATHPSRRGEGLGMNLLRANLRELDALGLPSYLESSNPANDARYRSVGYRDHGAIELPSGLRLTTFWRDPVSKREPGEGGLDRALRSEATTGLVSPGPDIQARAVGAR